VGEELDAVITGVEQFGIFCQGLEIPVEGMVHISALDADDFFDYDAATFSLVGRRKGKQYRLGDRVRVSVAHVDVDRRQLDFRVVALVAQRRGGASKRAMPDAGGSDGHVRKVGRSQVRSQTRRGEPRGRRTRRRKR
jgi:ribonuclease R